MDYLGIVIILGAVQLWNLSSNLSRNGWIRFIAVAYVVLYRAMVCSTCLATPTEEDWDWTGHSSSMTDHDYRHETSCTKDIILCSASKFRCSNAAIVVKSRNWSTSCRACNKHFTRLCEYRLSYTIQFLLQVVLQQISEEKLRDRLHIVRARLCTVYSSLDTIACTLKFE